MSPLQLIFMPRDGRCGPTDWRISRRAHCPEPIEAPSFNARHYHGSTGTCSATAAVEPCSTLQGADQTGRTRDVWLLPIGGLISVRRHTPAIARVRFSSPRKGRDSPRPYGEPGAKRASRCGRGRERESPARDSQIRGERPGCQSQRPMREIVHLKRSLASHGDEKGDENRVGARYQRVN